MNAHIVCYCYNDAKEFNGFQINIDTRFCTRKPKNERTHLSPGMLGRPQARDSMRLYACRLMDGTIASLSIFITDTECVATGHKTKNMRLQHRFSSNLRLEKTKTKNCFKVVLTIVNWGGSQPQSGPMTLVERVGTRFGSVLFTDQLKWRGKHAGTG